MADSKLSALTELAVTPADADEVYIRDVSEAASAESKRITVANLLAGAVGKSIATGTYVGAGAATDVQKTTGFKCSMVIIQGTVDADESFILIPSMTIRHRGTSHDDKTTLVYLHATDGFAVGNHVAYGDGDTYYWWAISE